MGGREPSSQHVGKVLTTPDEHTNNTDDNSSNNIGNDSGVWSRTMDSG